MKRKCNLYLLMSLVSLLAVSPVSAQSVTAKSEFSPEQELFYTKPVQSRVIQRYYPNYMGSEVFAASCLNGNTYTGRLYYVGKYRNTYCYSGTVYYNHHVCSFSNIELLEQ